MQSIRIVMRWLAVSLPVCLALVSSTAALASGTTVNGNIGLNQCGGNSGNQPIFTVKLSTNPVMTTTTNGNGAFSFLNVPNGTYTVTPSISGPSAVFYPATRSVTATTSSTQSVSFQAAVGYTVSGTVGYAGSATGRIYVSLISNNCGGGALPGTSIATKGAFTIRGVAPGSYSVQAWMDTLGYGVPNAADPSTNVNTPVNFSVTNANVTGVSASLGTPPAVTLSSAPGIQQAQAFSGGAFLFFQPITNNNGVELATSYTVQWSPTQTFPATVPTSQTKTFPGVGSNGTGIWIINGLTNTTSYYFRVRGVAGTSTSAWYETPSPLTINAPSGANTVSGAVTFAGTATGPLYTGFYDGNTNKVYVTQVGSKASPPNSPATYSVKLPSSTSGPNYVHFGILDNMNLGVIVPGDVADTNGNNSAPVAITGNQTGVGLALPTGASTSVLATQYNQQINQNGTNTNYNLQFQIDPVVKQPVNVTLNSASNPNVVVPQDLGQCNNCGGNGGVDFGIGINGDVPKVGDSYGFAVTYSDGTVGTASAAVTGVLSSLPSHLQPAGAGTNYKPNFSWTDPTNAGNYTYQFQLMDANYNTIWQIPGKDNGGSGFPSSLTSLTWGVAPAGYSGDTPSVTQLSAQEYIWSVQAADTHNNSSMTQVDYYPGYTALALPTQQAANLPGAAKGVSYTATIAATGGFPCYNYQVSGSLSSYGLSWHTNGSCGSPLTISGTPTSSGTASFSVQVNDSGNNQVSQSYSITIGGGALSLPQPTGNTDTISTLGSALQNAPYNGTLTASGGSAPYTWIVNGATLASVNSPVAVASGNGLTVTNTGSNTLTFGGLPSIASPITLHVTVKNGSIQAAGTYQIIVILGPNGSNNSALSGRYSCLTEGFNDSDGSRWASLSSFTAAGGGAFSNGVWDENGSDQNAASTGTLTGSYSINTDNNGIAVLSLSQSGHPTQVSEWAIALTGSAKPAVQFRAVEFDTTGQHGIANCYLDTTSAFAGSTLSGKGFAFDLNGEKVSSNGVSNVPLGRAAAGRFSASSGTITNGIIDIAKAGTAAAEEDTFTGSYTAPDANGRTTLTLNSGGSPVTMAVYIIDSTRMFMLETTAGDGVLVGNLRTQSGTVSSNAALSGPFVIYAQGASFGSGDVFKGIYSQVIQGTSSGNGVLVANASFADEAGTYVANGTVGTDPALTFASANPGRATLSTGGGELYLYFFGTNSAFLLSTDGNGGYNTGWLEKQTAPTISNTALAGTYMAGPLPLTTAAAIPSVGEYKLSGTAITAAISTAGSTTPGITFNFDAPVNMSYLLASTANKTITISGSSGGFASCIAISSAPIKLACTLQNAPSPSVFLLQQ